MLGMVEMIEVDRGTGRIIEYFIAIGIDTRVNLSKEEMHLCNFSVQL